MPRQRHEARFAEPITEVFNVLVRVLALRRWGMGAADAGEPMPKTGCRYARQSRSVLRRGRVLEIIRPVSLTLYETLHDPPCRVRLKLRWHIYPVEAGSLLRLNLRYQLNSAAALRKRHWNGRLHAHCARMLYWVKHNLEQGRIPQGAAAGETGQKNGKSDMVARNTTTVSGRPILR